MTKFRNSPRRLNLLPRKLDSRLADYARGILAANSPAVVGFRDTAQELGLRGDWFTIVSEQLEYLECTRADTTETVHVSKPLDLRGFIASRTFASDIHDITPAYDVGTIIQGLSFAQGHGHSFSEASLLKPYKWFDLNTEARAWARRPDP